MEIKHHIRKLKKMNKADKFIKKLKRFNNILTKQQLKTLRGQAIKGDVEAAEKGLDTLIKRNGAPLKVSSNAD